jgi:hypothetical protein
MRSLFFIAGRARRTILFDPVQDKRQLKRLLKYWGGVRVGAHPIRGLR